MFMWVCSNFKILRKVSMVWQGRQSLCPPHLKTKKIYTPRTYFFFSSELFWCDFSPPHKCWLPWWWWNNMILSSFFYFFFIYIYMLSSFKVRYCFPLFFFKYYFPEADKTRTISQTLSRRSMRANTPASLSLE